MNSLGRLLLLLLATVLLHTPAFGADDGAEGNDGEAEEDADEEGEDAPPWETGSTGTPDAAPAPAPATVDEPEDTSWSEDIAGIKGGGALGLGFAVGTINGLSLKVWPHKTHGIVLHVGVPRLLNSMAVSLSYRIHPPVILVPDSPVALHVNLGPLFRARMVFGASVFAELAGGVAVGVSVTVRDVPVEIFFEVAPLFAGSVTPVGVGRGFDVDGVVGARFYF